MPKFSFNKLVRNKIVALQEKDGYTVISHPLQGSDLVDAIMVKIHEEAEEVSMAIASGDRTEIIQEIADLEELIATLKNAVSIDNEEIVMARLNKNVKSGSFSRGIFIDYIDLPEGDQWEEYYRNQPNKYPLLDETD
jgi:predicted house-cleaning noncanonical NTP pyrophosphatase (MazG superfamily)